MNRRASPKADAFTQRGSLSRHLHPRDSGTAP